MKIANVNEEHFPTRDFNLPLHTGSGLDKDKDDGESESGSDNKGEGREFLSIDASAHDWTNYFKAGMNGAARLMRNRKVAMKGKFQESNKTMRPLGSVGIQVFVDGQVPTGAGLSSSAALVCASLMATLRAHGVDDVDKTELVELAIVAERAVGVNAGGYVSRYVFF